MLPLQWIPKKPEDQGQRISRSITHADSRQTWQTGLSLFSHSVPNWGKFFQWQVSITHFKQTSKAFEYQHGACMSPCRASDTRRPHTQSHLFPHTDSSSFACSTRTAPLDQEFHQTLIEVTASAHKQKDGIHFRQCLLRVRCSEEFYPAERLCLTLWGWIQSFLLIKASAGGKHIHHPHSEMCHVHIVCERSRQPWMLRCLARPHLAEIYGRLQTAELQPQSAGGKIWRLRL